MGNYLITKKVKYNGSDLTVIIFDTQNEIMEFESFDAQKVIDVFLQDLEKYMSTSSLSENEVKLGLALIDLFDNYGDVFIDNSNNKFNKNIVLFFLRENTNLNTKEIRVYLKKYKILYLETLRKLNNQ
jgi:hypothetical protein